MLEVSGCVVSEADDAKEVPPVGASHQVNDAPSAPAATSVATLPLHTKRFPVTVGLAGVVCAHTEIVQIQDSRKSRIALIISFWLIKKISRTLPLTLIQNETSFSCDGDADQERHLPDGRKPRGTDRDNLRDLSGKTKNNQ